MEIPAYQTIDIILGKPERITKSPVKGFAVTFSDKRSSQLFEGENMPEINDPKATIHKAWIHYQDVYEGKTSERKHWSPR